MRFLTGVDWVRLGVLTVAALFLAHLAWHDARLLLRRQPLGIDFLPMWAGAREALLHSGRIYDFAALTHVVRPLLGRFHGWRPFVYPPTALLAFAPFAFAPFSLANAAWTAVGLVALVWTMAEQLGGRGRLVLAVMVLSPASVLVAITGQVTFLIAAATVIALASLKRRPWLAGTLLGLAASMKPQTLVLLPVALIGVGQWRALVAAAASAAAAVAASLAIYGAELWPAWLAALPRFEQFVMHAPGLERGMVTPTSLGLWMGLHRDALVLWRLGFGGAAAAMAWLVFRRTDDLARRLTALLGGGLFVTPYAMHYDAALLAPAAVLLLARPSRPGAWLMALGAGALLCCAVIPHWGAAAVTAFVLLVACGGESPAPDLAWDAATKPIFMLMRRRPASA